MSGATEVWRLQRGAAGFPESVADLGSRAPRRLYGLGDRGLVSALEPSATVTIVGTRHPSAYGLRVARELAHGLSAAGLVVVSGMAIGIDSAAHRGALDAGGRTIAVLGCGPNVIYPRRGRDLHREIVATGAVVAEYPPGTEAAPFQFPERNRIMAALGGAVVVVEAKDPSGSLITADEGIGLGRAVGAVPGNVGVGAAAGTNRLIKEGAQVIRDAQDVLDLLLGVGACGPGLDGFEVRAAGPPLDTDLRDLLAHIAGGASTADRIASEGAITAQQAAIGLTRLELLGYVGADGTGGYARTELEPPD
jgi:DNA processing protein